MSNETRTGLKTLDKEKTHIDVEYAGKKYNVEVAQTPQQLQEAKALDDLAFGTHLGITMEELMEISKHGKVLLLRNIQGELIGESQVITSPISQHQHMDANEAYNYGTAILPNLQNEGLAQVLFKAQEIVAKEAGKTRSTLTARLENPQSLRGRFKAGFHIVGYDRNHYGPFENGGARVLLEKDLSGKYPLIFSTQILIDHLQYVKIVSTENIDEVLNTIEPLIGILVNPGDEIDYVAHDFIDKIFSHNHLFQHNGVGLLKPEEFGNVISKQSLLILKLMPNLFKIDKNLPSIFHPFWDR